MTKKNIQNNKTMKRGVARLALSVAMLTPIITGFGTIVDHSKLVQAAVANQAVYFKDVPTSHWAFSSIEWGRKNEYVKGFPDGTFRPNTSLTEAEATAILVRFFENIDETSVSGAKHWSDGVYATAKANNFPLKGYSNVKIKNTPVTRGVLADVLYKSQGNSGKRSDAINWLFANDLASGKSTNGSNTEKFDENSYLTRAEMMAFLVRMQNNGITLVVEPKESPPIQSKEPYNGPSKPLDLENATKLVESLPSFPSDGNKETVALPGLDPVTKFSTSPNGDEGVTIVGGSTLSIVLKKNSSSSDKALFKDILKQYFPNNYETVYNDALKNGAQTGKKADGIEYSTGHQLSQYDGRIRIEK